MTTLFLFLLTMQYCDECGVRAATIFLTKITGNSSAQRKLCEECAHLASDSVLEGLDLEAFTAAPEEFVSHLFDQAVAAGLITAEEAEALKDQGALESVSFNEITPEEMARLLKSADGGLRDEGERDETEDAEPDAYTQSDDDDHHDGSERETPDFDLAELARMTRDAERVGRRCPKCDMTWDRLKEDGRAGCAQCYSTFEIELREVMEKLQMSTVHTGKIPRSAEKRLRRLEQLRRRRDSQLELLQRRLEESIAAEKYEEAAKLRDRIKVVSSTIVDE